MELKEKAMKANRYIFNVLCGCALLWATACTDSDSPADESTDREWVFSRTGDTSEPFSIRMLGKSQDSQKYFNKTITFESNNKKGIWENGSPTWNQDDVFDLTAYQPVDKTLPADGNEVDATVAYSMQHWKEQTHNNRPNGFSLTPLHGRLKLVIDVMEKETEQHQPQEVKLVLSTKGKMDYKNHEIIPYSAKDTLTVGVDEITNADDNTQTAAELTDHLWSSNEFIIIPQTLKAGEPAITFYIEDKLMGYGTAKYKFVPPTKIELMAGQLTTLTLSVEYKPEEKEKEIIVVSSDVTIGQWQGGEDLGNGEAE